MNAQSQRNSLVCDALRIPDEIWHEIILIACDSQNFPLPLYNEWTPPPVAAPRQLKPLAKIMSNVCVRWNRLIVSASLLWVTTLVFLHDFNPSSLETYSRWLRDSKNSDIDIFILSFLAHTDVDLDDIIDFVQLALPFSARWRTFYASGSSRCTWRILKLLPENLDTSRLNSLALNPHINPPSVPFLFRPKTTVLRYLHLKSMILNLPLNPHLVFSALDTLELVGCDSSWEELATMLAQMPVLRSLTLDGMYGHSEPASEIVHFNILSDICIIGRYQDAIRILRIIRSPVLNKLELKCGEAPLNWDPSFVGPPDFWPSVCLKHLTILIDIAEFTRLAPLLVCPELETLEMTVCHHWYNSLGFQISESLLTKGGVFSNLKTVRLCSVSYSVFIFVLKHMEMPALTSLYLSILGFHAVKPQELNYADMDSSINLPLLTELTINSLPGGHNETALEYLFMPSLKNLSLLREHTRLAGMEGWNNFATRYRDILKNVENLSVAVPDDWTNIRPLFPQLDKLKSLTLDFLPLFPKLLRCFRFSKQVQVEKSVLSHTGKLIWLPPLLNLDVIIHKSHKYDQTQTIASLKYLVTKRVRAGNPRMNLKVVPTPEGWPEEERAWMEARVELEGNVRQAEGKTLWWKKRIAEQSMFQFCRRSLSRVKQCSP